MKIRIRRVQIYEFRVNEDFYNEGITPAEMLKIEMSNARTDHEYFDMINKYKVNQLIEGHLIKDE